MLQSEHLQENSKNLFAKEFLSNTNDSSCFKKQTIKLFERGNKKILTRFRDGPLQASRRSFRGQQH